MTDEKRRQERFVIRKPLWCEGQDNPVGEAHNASMGGMFIVADEESEVGQEIQVNFKDDQDEISLKMEVMWKGTEPDSGETGMGVRIVGFDKGEDVYKRFLNRQAPSSVPAPQTSPQPANPEADATSDSQRP